jgi:hypothetical protein
VDDVSPDGASGDQTRFLANILHESSTSPINDDSGETALAQTSEYMKIATPLTFYSGLDGFNSPPPSRAWYDWVGRLLISCLG